MQGARCKGQDARGERQGARGKGRKARGERQGEDIIFFYTLLFMYITAKI